MHPGLFCAHLRAPSFLIRQKRLLFLAYIIIAIALYPLFNFGITVSSWELVSLYGTAAWRWENIMTISRLSGCLLAPWQRLWNLGRGQRER
jgi:hypothetical protein